VRFVRGLTLFSLLAVTSGCMMIGPDYETPPAPVAEGWLGHSEGVIAPSAEPLGPWWESFGDPILTNLIVQAYEGNPTLQAAGVRVLEAQARRGIAIGTIFPQTQNARGGYVRQVFSENANNSLVVPDRSIDSFMLGFDVAWELDLWGGLRRGIEASDAELLAALADYDDVLVSLLAAVATNYIGIRTAEEQLAVARSNVDIQRRSLGIATRRSDEGAVTAVDPSQSATLLYNTEAQIPTFEALVDALAATLSTLLGVPPRRVEELLGNGPDRIPAPARQVALGIPADLLRRRPDVRRAERLLAAQSARIGVAKADLLPHLSLVGTIGLSAEDAAKFFEGRSFEAFGGPTFSWKILNYGRVQSNVRVQDAEYQALVNDYTNAVLQAQGEVEAAVATYRGSLLRTESLRKSVSSAQKVVDLTGSQYGEGAVDFTTVILSQQFLIDQENAWVASRGQTAADLVTLYKSLGGGWEPWEGRSVVSDQTVKQMADRTRWGDLLAEHEQRKHQQDAATGTEKDRGWWRWRWWSPEW
jgi:NodT family efflux transporter outer membrane factor (OMF) lipoprotein